MINESAIKQSFSKIKEEIDTLKQQNNFLYTELDNLKKTISQNSEKDQNAEALIKRIEEKLDSIQKDKPKNVFEKFDTQIIPENIDSIDFIRNKIKKKIIELCKTQRKPGDLKRTIVNTAKLCSRATFYRYLNELKKSSIIQTIEINNDIYLITTNSITNRNIYK